MTVAIDEFASFAFEEFTELLNKARSAKISLILSHQSLGGDLLQRGEHFFRQIVANTNVKACAVHPRRNCETGHRRADVAGETADHSVVDHDLGRLG